jgi:pimeloyl-ACP methyl ester carboxylesterase
MSATAVNTVAAPSAPSARRAPSVAVPAAVNPRSRETVVLLHSSASSARQWQPAILALQASFAVHAVEFHDHGAQPGWRGDAPMTLADEAALAEPLLAQAGGAHVVGHSYGAAVALKLASRRPALVRSVVAYEPVLFGLLFDDAGSRCELQAVVAIAEAMRQRLAQGQALAAARGFIEFWSGAGAWTALPAERQQAFAARMPAVLQHFEALFGDPLTCGDLARLRMPLLLASGARTVPSARRIVQLVGAAQPKAQREVLDEMGHMGPITHAATFNRRVIEFLRAHAEPTTQHEGTGNHAVDFIRRSPR